MCGGVCMDRGGGMVLAVGAPFEGDAICRGSPAGREGG